MILTLRIDVAPENVPELAKLRDDARWLCAIFQAWADHQPHCRKNRNKGGNCICGLDEVKDKVTALRRTGALA